MDPMGFSFSTHPGGVFLVGGSFDDHMPLPTQGHVILNTLFLNGAPVAQLVYAAPRSGPAAVPPDGGVDPFDVSVPDVPVLAWIVQQPSWRGADRNVLRTVLQMPTLKRGAHFGDLVAHESYAQAMLPLQGLSGGGGPGAKASAAQPRLRSRWLRAAMVGWGGFKVLLALVMAAGLFVVYAKTLDQDVRLSALQMMAASQLSPSAGKIRDATGARLDAQGLQTLKRIVGESAVSRSDEGDPFVMFSDPNCPSCKAFEQRMTEMGRPFKPLIIPVSFQKGSAEAVAGVLCAKDVGKAWDEAVAGSPPPACENGRIQAQRNNEAFTSLGFDSTPTFVAVSGAYAKGFSDVNDLLAWVGSQSAK